MAKLLKPNDPKLKRARAIAMDLPGVTERMSHGYPNWRTSKGQFAAYNDFRGYPVLFFLLDANVAEKLLGSDERFWDGGKGTRGRRWLGLNLTGKIDWRQAKDLIVGAYDQVAPSPGRPAKKHG